MLGPIVVLFVGATTGWVLLAPVPSTFALAVSDGQFGALATSLPLAAAVGCVLAAAVAGSLSRRGTPRSAWATAAAGLATVAAAVLVGRLTGQADWLTVANYAAGIGAGLALGAAAATASSRAVGGALAGGVFAAFLLAPVFVSGFAFVSSRRYADYGWTAYTPLTDADATADAVPWWLLLPALAGVIVLAVVGSGTLTLPAARGVTATFLVVITALLTNAAIGTAPNDWALAAPLVAVFALAVGAAAFVLDGRDGRLVLTTTAVVVTGAPLLVGMDTTAIGVGILGVTLAAGVAVGVRWPNVLVGLGLLALTGAAGLFPAVDDRPLELVRWLVFAPIAGYALSSCVPARGGAAVAGLSVLLVPSALTAAGQSAESSWLDPHTGHSVFTGLPRGIMVAPPADPQVLSLVGVVVSLGAAVAVWSLITRRSIGDRRGVEGVDT